MIYRSQFHSYSVAQFNASSENQTNQFMNSLSTTISQQNAARNDAMNQYNTTEGNRIAALNQNNDLEAERLEATLTQEVDKYNAQLDFNRNQFNTQNANLIEQSNVTWRRQLNQANTAGQNAVNQANAMNSFNLSNQGLSFLWQEMRDAAKWEYDSSNNELDRKSQIAIAALGNESVSDTNKVGFIKNLGELAFKVWANK